MGKHFVLLHGAWHGGWCWEGVVKELEKAGHTADLHYPTLKKGYLDLPHTGTLILGGPLTYFPRHLTFLPMENSLSRT